LTTTQGYQTREELIASVEENFPFVSRPGEADLFVFDGSDLMRRIIEKSISQHKGKELPYEGIVAVYDEFGSMTDKAVQWIMPSLLRIVVCGTDRSGNLPGSLVNYFENCTAEKNSAYNFSWLTAAQVSTLISVM